MVRPHSSSAGARFVKPVLEILEDRVVPSPFGNLLNDYANAVGTTTRANINIDVGIVADGFSKIADGAGFPSVLLMQMQGSAKDLAGQAALLQQQSAFFSAALVQGLQLGLVSPSEAGPLLDTANGLAQLAATAQQDVNQAIGLTVTAILASVDLGQGNDLNMSAVANGVAGGVGDLGGFLFL